MRTDKEQFEKITSEFEAHEKRAKVKRRVWTIVIASVLATALLVSSVLVIPGLFKRNEAVNDVGSEPKLGGEEYYITDKGKADKVTHMSDVYMKDGDGYFGWEAAPAEAEFPGGISGYSDRTDSKVYEPEVDGSYDHSDFEVIGGAPGGESGDQTQYTAGTLTGAELKDNRYFEDFVKSVNELLEKSSAIGTFDLTAVHRGKVTVKNGETPLAFVNVELLDASGRSIYKAVTNNKGEAWLFYNLCVQSDDKPAKVVCTFDGKSAEVSLEQYGSVLPDLEVQLEGASSVRKLDLMFMIDTTGSMGDELEYIKTEIRDIISKIVGDQQYVVRTSVNFYRDKDDEYIVHATPFCTDAEDVYEYIRKEHSAGGGDYPEAVHTALDNAVNGHEWDDGAVKLCFFVLDAPPHTDTEVAESLRASILAAAEKGVRIIPIVSSGSDSLTEYLMRTFAVLTGGTYTFLTDHSGIGNSHSEPDTTVQYEIEKLNDMIVRIAKEYLA